MNKKSQKRLWNCLIIGTILISIFSLYSVFAPSTSNNLENTFSDLGITGMKLNSFNVSGISITDLSEQGREDFDLTNEFKKTKEGIKQDIYLKNKKEQKDFSFSTIIEINYSEIRWNGTLYDIGTEPLYLKCFEKNKKLVCPNIFMDEKYNKRINYQDIGNKGGYAIAYEKKGKYYIELRIDNVNIASKENYYLDPTYINQTDGFFHNLGGNARGIAYNGSDLWIGTYSPSEIHHFNSSQDDIGEWNPSVCGAGASSVVDLTIDDTGLWAVAFGNPLVCQYSPTGTNLSGAFFTTTELADTYPAGIYGNGSDLWIHDFNTNINHLGGSRNNMSNGFFIPDDTSSSVLGITSNGSDFWWGDLVDDFIYHTKPDGTNGTEGFDLTADGIVNIVSLDVAYIGSQKEFWILDDIDQFAYHYIEWGITTIDNPTNTSYIGATIDFNISVSGKLSLAIFSLDGFLTNYTMTKNNSLQTANYTLTPISDGSHKADFYVNDTSGNVNFASVHFTIVDAGFHPISINARGVARLNSTDFFVGNMTGYTIMRFSSGNLVHEFPITNCNDKGDSVVDITSNGSDVWTTNWQGDFICHFDTYGNNLSDGFFTSSIGNINPSGITTNGSDFWIYDYLAFVGHIDSSGNNMSDGWSIPPHQIGQATELGGYGITTNGSDFWMLSSTDSFVYHFDNVGNNITDGFSVASYGIVTPYGIEIDDSKPEKEYWIFDDFYDFVFYLKEEDVSPPVITIDSPTNISYEVTTIDFNISSNENLSWSVVSLDDFDINYTLTINNSLKTANYTLTSISEGSHKASFYSNDSVGLINFTSVHFLVDTTEPDINITFPINNTSTVDINININYTVSDTNLDSCWYSNDTYSVNTTLSNCVNITDVTWIRGHHNVTVWANDSANNVNSSSVTFYIYSIYQQNITQSLDISPDTDRTGNLSRDISQSSTIGNIIKRLSNLVRNPIQELNLNNIVDRIANFFRKLFQALPFGRYEATTEGLVSWWTFDIGEANKTIAKDKWDNNDGIVIGAEQLDRMVLDFDTLYNSGFLSTERKEGRFSNNVTTGVSEYNIILTYTGEDIDVSYYNNETNDTNAYLTFWVWFEDVSLLEDSRGIFKLEFGNENNVNQSTWGSDEQFRNIVAQDGWNYYTVYFDEGTYNNKATINWSEIDYIEFYARNNSATQCRILIDDMRIHSTLIRPVIGSAYEFDGVDDHITLINSSNNDTISAWVNNGTWYHLVSLNENNSIETTEKTYINGVEANYYEPIEDQLVEVANNETDIMFLDTDTSYINNYTIDDGSATEDKLSFTTTQKYFSGVSIYITDKGTGNITARLFTSGDTEISKSGNGVTTPYGLNVNLPSSGWYFLPLSSILDVDSDYYIRLYSTVSDTKIKTDTSEDIRDATYKLHYTSKPNITVGSYDFKSDGFLDTSNLNLSTGVFTYQPTTFTKTYDATFSDLYETSQTTHFMLHGSGDYDIYLSYGYITYKINTILPALRVKVNGLSYSTDRYYNASYSFDNVNWVKILDSPTSSGASAEFNAQRHHIFYIKFEKISGGVNYVGSTFKVQANVDLSGIPFDGDILGLQRGGYFNGSIDEVRIYNRSLTANEINQIYLSKVNEKTFDVTKVYTGIRAIDESFILSTIVNRVYYGFRKLYQFFTQNIIVQRVGNFFRNIYEFFTTNIITDRITGVFRNIYDFFTTNIIMERFLDLFRDVPQEIDINIETDTEASFFRNLYQKFITNSFVSRLISMFRNVDQPIPMGSYEFTTDNLVGWWTLDEDSNLTDLSGEGRDGIAQAGSSHNESGYFDWCYKFDSTDVQDKVKFGTEDDFEVGNHTFALWIRPIAQTNYQYIFDHYNWRFITTTSNRYHFLVGRMKNDSGPTEATGLAFSVYSNDNAVQENTWIHLVAVYSPDYTNGNGKIELYENGILVDDADIERQRIWEGYGDDEAQLGNSDHGNAIPFNGSADEVMIFNRSLSSSEIQQIYEATSNDKGFAVDVKVSFFRKLSQFFTQNIIVKRVGNFFRNIYQSFTSNSAVSRFISIFRRIFQFFGFNFFIPQPIAVDITNPNINLTNPQNTTYVSNVIELRYTASDSHLDSCWWSNNSGVTNYSITCGDYVTLSANQGSNTWLVGANDTTGNQNMSIVTFTVDGLVRTPGTWIHYYPRLNQQTRWFNSLSVKSYLNYDYNAKLNITSDILADSLTTKVKDQYDASVSNTFSRPSGNISWQDIVYGYSSGTSNTTYFSIWYNNTKVNLTSVIHNQTIGAKIYEMHNLTIIANSTREINSVYVFFNFSDIAIVSNVLYNCTSGSTGCTDDISDRSDVTFSDLDGDGTYDFVEWFVDSITSNRSYVLKNLQGYPIQVTEDIDILNAPIKPFNNVNWRNTITFYNPNSYETTKVYKLELPFGSRNIEVDDISKNLQYDIFGILQPYILILDKDDPASTTEIRLAPGQTKTIVVEYITDSVTISSQTYFPTYFEVDEMAQIVNVFTIKNQADSVVEDIEHRIKINYAEDLILCSGDYDDGCPESTDPNYDNVTIETKDEVKGDYKLELDSIGANDVEELTLSYYVPTATVKEIEEGRRSIQGVLTNYKKVSIESLSHFTMDDLRYKDPTIKGSEIVKVLKCNPAGICDEPLIFTNAEVKLGVVGIGEKIDFYIWYTPGLPEEPVGLGFIGRFLEWGKMFEVTGFWRYLIGWFSIEDPETGKLFISTGRLIILLGFFILIIGFMIFIILWRKKIFINRIKK